MYKKVLFALFFGLVMTAWGHQHHDHSSHEETTACSEKHDHDHDHEAHSHNHEGDGHGHEAEEKHEAQEGTHDNEIQLSPEEARQAGVQVSEIHPGSFHEVIPVTGSILSAQGDEASVVAGGNGVVILPRPVTEGCRVEKGTVLFYITADALQDGSPLKKTRIAYETAKEEFERAERMLAERLITRTEYNAAKERFETARVAYEATASSQSSSIAVKAPSGGYVQNCTVKAGDYVSTGQLLATVVQHNKLYLQADVPLRYSRELSRIRSAKFIPEYSKEVYDTKMLHGRVLSYSRVSGAQSSYLPLTFEIESQSGLVAGSFAQIYLIGEERTDVISLPVSALTEEQGEFFVYRQTDSACYRKCPVKIGMRDGEIVEITEGIHNGDKVVTQGAIHVRLASAANAIPAHNHNH